MKKIPLNLLILCVFAFALLSCVSANAVNNVAEAVKPAEAPKAKTSCPGDLFWEGTGTGKSLSEARADAKAKIASDIISLVESQIKTEKRKEEDNEEKITTSSSFSDSSQINSPLTALYGFKEMVAPRQLENGDYEFKGYVCNSDAAKPYLAFLRTYKDSLEALKGHKLNKDVCGKASGARKDMRDFETILEVLKQMDKVLQKEYDDVYDEIKKGCGLEAGKKLHWNPEKQNAYSEMAFSRLSASLEMETSPCKGKGISLVFKGNEPDCKSRGGPYACSYLPSLQIAFCDGTKIRLLESPEPIRSFDPKGEVAMKKLQDKLKTENFWNEWEQEIKRRSSQ